MSLKPVDIDIAIKELKNEGSNQAMRSRARTNLNRNKPSRLPRYGLVGSIATLAIVILYPRATTSLTWAQAVINSVQALNVHCVSRYNNGQIFTEEWTKGTNHSWVMLDKQGTLMDEWRGDENQTYHYFHLVLEDQRIKNPNKRSFGELFRRKPGSPSMFHPIGGKLTDYLKGRDYKVLTEANVQHSRGSLKEFHVSLNQPYHEEFTATVDANTGLVTKILQTEGRNLDIDYPKSIPDDVFTPTPHGSKGVEVYDILAQKALIRNRMNQGLGTSNGVTLRLVALDYLGGLWVLWSGLPANGRMDNPYTVAGVKLGAPYGPRKLTSSADGKNDVPPILKDGSRVYGMGRIAMDKVGETVDVKIPTPKGTATFAKVPVMRIGMIYAYEPWHNSSPGVNPFE